MIYDFHISYTRDLFAHLLPLVPIKFIRDEHMADRAAMDFNHDSQSVEIRYKSTAHEIVDIGHELIHVRMQFVDEFPLLAWPTNCSSISSETKDAVKIIRDAVDDTFVLRQLYAETTECPVSDVFYNEIGKDLKNGSVGLVRNVPVSLRPMLMAWRLRLADLSRSEFKARITPSQNQLASEFLAQFQDKDPIARGLFDYLKHNVGPAHLTNSIQLGSVLMSLCKGLGLPSDLHLATWRKVDKGWQLRRMERR